MSDSPKIIAVREWAFLAPFFVLMTIVAFVLADNKRLTVEKSEAEISAEMWRGAAYDNDERVARCLGNGVVPRQAREAFRLLAGIGGGR